MTLTNKVKKIIKYYQSETPGVKSNIVKILMSGKLMGTGKMVILPVDQGFEHGPDVSFSTNSDAYDPEYHVRLAIDANLNAYAAPKGMLEAITDDYRGVIPLILKANSSNSLVSDKNEPNQSITASVRDAIYLGCTAIGFTIYPGSGNSIEMIQQISEMISEAKSSGMATIVWSYPRGGDLSKKQETSIKTISYAAHIAAEIGANIIKVKLPDITSIKKDSLAPSADYQSIQNLTKAVSHIMQASFSCRRLVVFSGGLTKTKDEIYKEATAIYNGGGSGSIIGRNSFQRPYKEALDLLSKITDIYLGK